MTSEKMRENPLFMRNSFEGQGKWDIPLVRKQEIDVSTISLIACSDTRSKDSDVNRRNGVHFFVDDYRFDGIYIHPERSLKSTHSMHFFSVLTFLHMLTWIYGGNWKVSLKIDGLAHIGRVKD